VRRSRGNRRDRLPDREPSVPRGCSLTWTAPWRRPRSRGRRRARGSRSGAGAPKGRAAPARRRPHAGSRRPRWARRSAMRGRHLTRTAPCRPGRSRGTRGRRAGSSADLLGPARSRGRVLDGDRVAAGGLDGLAIVGRLAHGRRRGAPLLGIRCRLLVLAGPCPHGTVDPQVPCHPSGRLAAEEPPIGLPIEQRTRQRAAPGVPGIRLASFLQPRTKGRRRSGPLRERSGPGARVLRSRTGPASTGEEEPLGEE